MNELVSALHWSLVHSLWLGACAALVLRGALAHGAPWAARRPQARYAAALLSLLALPIGFAWTLARELGPSELRLSLADVSPAVLADPEAFARMAFARGPLDGVRAWIGEHTGPFETWIVGAWALCIVLLTLRLAGGWVWCRRFLRLRAVPAAPGLQARTCRIARRIGLRRRVRLYLSHRAHPGHTGPVVPMVIWGAVPAVVVPHGALKRLPVAHFDALLAHELAHVRRLDGPVNLLQRAVETLFFFHPAVRWISARARAEREHCCDDAALAACAGPLVLARALATLEEHRSRSTAARFGARTLALAADDGCLLARVERLLMRRRPARRTARAAAFACSLVGLGGLALAAVPTREPPALVRIEARAFERELELPGDRNGEQREISVFVLGEARGSEAVDPSKVRLHVLAGPQLELHVVRELELDPEWTGGAGQLAIKRSRISWKPRGSTAPDEPSRKRPSESVKITNGSM